MNWREECHVLKQRIATEGIAPVIKALKELLPKGTERLEDVLLIESRQNEANRDRLRNLLSDEELRRVYARIRQDLMDLLDALSEKDFNPETAEWSARPEEGPLRGSVLYRIPNRMPLGRATTCVVRISFDATTIAEGLDLDEHIHLKDIRISEVMQVNLIDPDPDPPFQIQAIHSTEQFIDRDTFTEWQFRVTPIREGTFPLLLKVAVLELVQGKERKREIVLAEEILIEAELPPVSDSTEVPLRTATRFVVGAGQAEELEEVDDLFSPSPSYRVDTQKKPGKSTADPFEPRFQTKDAQTRTNTSGNRTMVMRSLTVLLLVVGTTAGYLFAINPAEGDWLAANYLKGDVRSLEKYAQKYPDNRHTEQAYWKIADKRQKDEDFLVYLDKYPTGDFSDRALTTLQKRAVLPESLNKKELTEIRDIQILAEQTQEWQRMQKEVTTTTEAKKRLDDYQKKFPESYFEPQIKKAKKDMETGRLPSEVFDRIQVKPDQPSLLERNRLRRDSLQWRESRSIGTPDALKEYLIKFPDGLFAGTASDKLKVWRTERNPSDDIAPTRTLELERENIRLVESASLEDWLADLKNQLPETENNSSITILNFERAVTRIDSLVQVGKLKREEASFEKRKLKERLQLILDTQQ